MNYKNLLYIVILFFSACQSDDPGPENCTENSGVPDFVGEPSIINGADNAEIRVQVDSPAKVYYYITTAALDDRSPANVKAKAASGAEFSGSFQISCETVDTVNTQKVSGLPTNTKFFAYLVAESMLSGSQLQEESTEFTFTTGDQRLAVKSFPSTVKGRDALYVLYIPTENRPVQGEARQYPLIIFLGGNSEVAPEGQITVVQNGSVPEYISKGNHLPFVVIAPEHNTQSWDPNFIHEMVNHAIEHYSVDPDRIIITGLSGGGNGTIKYALNYPEVPAAIVPISGWADNLDGACAITGAAVWAFHNETDPKVQSSHSVRFIDTLNGCNPPPADEVKLTIFRDDGHIAWVRVYDPKSPDWNLDKTVEPINIYDWMYQQKK